MEFDLSKESYTNEEVKELHESLNAQVTELTTKLTESTTKIKEFEKEGLDSSVKLEMLKNGLDEGLFDLVLSTDLETSKVKIAKLVELNKANVVKDSYKPDNHKQQEQYEKYLNDGNIEGALKEKFKKLFV